MNQQGPGERPVVIRGALLMLGLVIVVSTIQQWQALPEGKPAPSVPLLLLPLLLASSLVVQFFAKTRGSPLLIVSLVLVVATLVLLWLVHSGRV